ncbi:ABC transporter ATP-binding protein [Solicola gregarius]|uniref:ABC transporter ATP-binding protein n=1 Tax=Solicola gregarius TaxID=2908642 RepID=A0AA46TK22_9ACTN|nr:ABC transporter ATP-binding protein [Solicola gregarius]UYM06774.1 ABC transporter ATP-binding protein [Solicola gregarius]
MNYAVDVRDVRVCIASRPVLDGVELRVASGEVVAIEGASGAGKSTLLHTVAGLIRPSSGSVEIAGRRIDKLNDRRRSALRLRMIGSVFQFGELLPEFNVIENVELPLRLLGHGRTHSRARAKELLEEVGIDDLAERGLSEVSGGQMQRAAIARALAHEPHVLLADEPTGSLDEDAAETVLKLLIDASHRHGAGLIVVTHHHDVARQCDRTLQLVHGTLKGRTDANEAVVT